MRLSDQLVHLQKVPQEFGLQMFATLKNTSHLPCLEMSLWIPQLRPFISFLPRRVWSRCCVPLKQQSIEVCIVCSLCLSVCGCVCVCVPSSHVDSSLHHDVRKKVVCDISLKKPPLTSLLSGLFFSACPLSSLALSGLHRHADEQRLGRA